MQLPPSWMPIIGDELTKPYFRELQQFLETERARQIAGSISDPQFAGSAYSPHTYPVGGTGNFWTVLTASELDQLQG